MSDNFYPKSTPSVDDILKEVRLMREAKSAPTPEKSEINIEPPKPEKEVPFKENEPKEEPKAEPKAEEKVAPKEEPKTEETSFAGEDKLSKFLSKTKDRGYVPGKSESAKQQINALFGQDEVIEPFKKKNRRAPHVLTVDEINKAPKDDIDTAKMFKNIHKADIGGFELDLDAIDKKQPKEEKIVNGFNIVADEAETEPTKVTDETVVFDVNEIEQPKEELEATRVIEISKSEPDDEVTDDTVVIGELPQNEQEEAEDAFSSQDIYSSSIHKDTEEPTFEIQEEQEEEPEQTVETAEETEEFVDLADALSEDFRIGHSNMPPKTFTREIKGFAVGGEEQDNEDGEGIEYEPEDEEIDDYHTIEDAESIKIDLETRSARLSKKITFTTVVGVILAALTIVPSLGLQLPEIISPLKNPQTFLIINSALMALAVIINLSGILRGFFNLIRLKPDIDTTVSLSVIASCVQSVYLFWHQSDLANGSVMIYTAVAVMAMIFNLLGKKCMISRVYSNFELVATTNVKQSCFIVNDNDAIIIAEDAVVGQPYLCCDRSVINLQGYLNNAFCEDPADNMCQTLSPIGLIASLVAGALIYFTTSSLTFALTTFAAVATTCVPLTSLLATNSPLLSASRMLRERGCMLSGYNAVEEFADVDCVAVNAEELFPSGSAELMSLKTLGDVSIDNVILDAASVAISAGGPLADIFDRMIEGRRKMLPKPQDLKYHDGKGISGTVGGKWVQIGKRVLMEELGVTNLPDIEIERRILRNETYPVYLAIDGVLSGMFIIKYTVSDEEMSEQLYRLANKGVTLLIKTSDPNITPSLISRLFDIPEEYVKIMPSHSVDKYDSVTLPGENGSGLMAHNNSISGFAAGIVACKNLRFKVVLATILQTIGVILGFGAIMFFALTQEFNMIVPHLIMAYQLIVAFIVLVIPAIGRS
ncbi:MAG: hypothetical protein IJF54_05765 [Clostridia bacterium]|nr:hypothetical protein [Clostridia bacterium]